MCNICLRDPCDSRCPNASEPQAVFICSGCGEDIYDGEDYWDIMGEQWCEECINNARRTAEYEPYDWDSGVLEDRRVEAMSS